MAVIPFGEWRPDVSDFNSAYVQTILNALPRGDGYGPVKDFSVYSAALPAACRGAFIALKTDGSVAVFAATSTKLYLMDNTALTFSDVSQAAGSYSAISATDQWQIRQFGNFVIAVQANVAPQVYDLTSSSEFEDLASAAAPGDEPPQARYIDIVGRFVVLSGLLSNPYRIQWSGLNSVNGATSWQVGTNSSDFQDLPDGGIVRGVAGGESGVVFQDRAIRRMTYAPGSPVIFQIERISDDNGLYAPYSLVRSGERIFFHSPKGFHKIEPGGFPQQIGKERVDRTFLEDLDTGNLQLFIGAGDPRGSRVFWAYKSSNGAAGLFDKILVYDYVLDRFTEISTSGEFLMSISQPGITLEGLDTISTSIDSGVLGPFDSYAGAVTPEVAAFNGDHQLGFYRGDNLEATLDTAEQSGARWGFVSGFTPITDAPTAYGSVLYRSALNAASTQSAEGLINAEGLCPVRVSARHKRGRIRIPAATTWTFASGIEPEGRA
jgi:hypothetical protein